MIFGKPEEFALYVDTIEERSNEFNDLEGISGIWLKNRLFVTNSGLISLQRDFENIIETAPQLIECSNLYMLNKLNILKEILKKRFPNWCANSDIEWEENTNEWLDIEETTQYDICLESCTMGNALSYYLFAIKNDDMVKIFMYIKSKENDFFNFETIVDSDVECVEISYKEFQTIIGQLESFIKKSRIDILGH